MDKDSSSEELSPFAARYLEMRESGELDGLSGDAALEKVVESMEGENATDDQLEKAMKELEEDMKENPQDYEEVMGRGRS
jgi:hypothetical protein